MHPEPTATPPPVSPIKKSSAGAKILIAVLVLAAVAGIGLGIVVVSKLASTTRQKFDNQAALADLQEKMSAHQEEAKKLFAIPDGPAPEDFAAHGDKGFQILKDAVPTFKGGLHTTMRNFVHATEEMEKRTVNYDANYARMENEALPSLRGVEDPAEIENRITIVREWLASNEEVRDAVNEWRRLETMKSQLKTKDEREFFEGVTIGVNRQIPNLMKIRDTDKELGEIFIKVLEIHKNEWGHFEAGEVLFDTIFESNEASDQMIELGERLDQLVVEQTEAQKALLLN